MELNPPFAECAKDWEPCWRNGRKGVGTDGDSSIGKLQTLELALLSFYPLLRHFYPRNLVYLDEAREDWYSLRNPSTACPPWVPDGERPIEDEDSDL
jgi:hypothetical protein